MFQWRDALVNVKSDTLIGWQRKRISSVLALEIEADWTTVPNQGPSAVDPRDGRRVNAG